MIKFGLCISVFAAQGRQKPGFKVNKCRIYFALCVPRTAKEMSGSFNMFHFYYHFIKHFETEKKKKKQVIFH